MSPIRSECTPSPLRRARRGTSLLEVVLAVFFMASAMLIFGALQPTSAKTSRVNGNYSQAVSLVQHKVDQLRAVGYGRLTYSELNAAGIIDTTPTAQPYHYETVDEIAQYLPSPTATVAFTSAGTDVMHVTITVAWQGAPDKAMQGSYSAEVLIPNE